MREQVVAFVEQLKAWPDGAARVGRPGGQPGDQVAERLDRRDHQRHGGIGEGGELGVGFLGVREEPLQGQQQDLVADVEQVHDALGGRVGDQQAVRIALARPDVSGDGRPGGAEGGVGLAQLLELVKDGDELTEVRTLPGSSQPFALLQDLVDRALGGRRVGHRDQFGPAEMLRARLCPRRADEQPVFAVLVGEVGDARLDRPVQVPDRGEVLAAGDDVASPNEGRRPVDRGQSLGVVQRHPLGALKEHEVPQRLLAERQQRQVNAGRVVAGGLREVRPGQVRRGADRGQQVLHQGQVQHLLGGDVHDLLAPALHRGGLGVGQPLGRGLLQRERREQVLRHDAVLQFGRLAQDVDQRLAVLDHERRLGRRQPAPGGDHLGQPPGRPRGAV